MYPLKRHLADSKATLNLDGVAFSYAEGDLKIFTHHDIWFLPCHIHHLYYKRVLFSPIFNNQYIIQIFLITPILKQDGLAVAEHYFTD